MDRLDDLDFDMLFEKSGEEYRARALNSPAGQAVSRFSLPFSSLEIENLLLRIGRTRRGVRRLESPEMEATRIFGGLDNGGEVVSSNTTVSGSSAGGSGGDVHNSGTATLTNVTLSGNSAGGYGGGLYSSSAALLTHATLSDNSAGAFGGGIFHNAVGFTVALNHSLVANSPSRGNCGGATLANTYNLSSDDACALAGMSSLNGTDPRLTALGDYGGPAPVHLLRPISPAIDLVAAGCPPPLIDRRGVNWPLDGDGDGHARCDCRRGGGDRVGPWSTRDISRGLSRNQEFAKRD